MINLRKTNISNEYLFSWIITSMFDHKDAIQSSENNMINLVSN